MSVEFVDASGLSPEALAQLLGVKLESEEPELTWKERAELFAERVAPANEAESALPIDTEKEE